MFLKGSDPRMSKNLTLAEFCVAFGVYPEHRVEMDDYLEKKIIWPCATVVVCFMNTINVCPLRRPCTSRNGICGWTGR